MSKEELEQLGKSELVDLIYTYWGHLKTQAENQMDDKVNYMMDEYGRVKMTQEILNQKYVTSKLNQKEDE